LEANQEKFVTMETEYCDSCESESVCHAEEKIVLKQAAGGR